jgi:lysozyme
MTSDLIVVDISHYQPTPNWDQLMDAGIVGVILKATEGTSYIDPTFFDRAVAARNAGFAVATYHFLRHGDIASQMEWYLQNISPDVGERLVLDYEHDDCRIVDLIQSVDYLLRVEDYNLQITCYGASKLTDDAYAADDEGKAILRNTSLWAARYSENQPKICTEVWPAWTLWQFTDSAKVAGIDGPVDGNRFNGSIEQCLKWFGPAGPMPQPGPEPAPEPEPAEVDIVTRGPVRITINGEIIVTNK